MFELICKAGYLQLKIIYIFYYANKQRRPHFLKYVVFPPSPLTPHIQLRVLHTRPLSDVDISFCHERDLMGLQKSTLGVLSSPKTI